ncbi:MAG: CheR family methyltransferase [Aromatoleum sp.]|jgi:chemotaxis protein methyltransferase CheR|uniref:CheR family methyltransferase n=1 Tax=Aromatoleum sp. TaxID=2307007 RepID=UPI002895B91F|nr:CheR family methyltransferase [Aromatoleum sp.]MDT3668935.1 CheR family methyltransferase [Aromatoleum sp.]
MKAPIPETVLQRFSEFVAERTGLHFPPSRRADLLRGLEDAAAGLGYGDVETCARMLMEAPPDRRRLDTLAHHLTVGETYFFRDPAVWTALEAEILPPLIAARRATDRHLRIWSAGCSTGEEAYSIAILLARLLPDLASWNVAVLGTDIDVDALARAEQGVYREWSFRGVSDGLRQAHFEAAGRGRFRVREVGRCLPRFAYLNLVDDVYPSVTNGTNAMDILFCRNVLMYFERSAAEAVARRFHRSVVDGGWLIVAAAEADAALFPGFSTVRIGDALLYRKEGTAHASPMSKSRGRQGTAQHGDSGPASRSVGVSRADIGEPAGQGRRVVQARAPRRPRDQHGQRAAAGPSSRPEALALACRECANRGEFDEARRLGEAAVAADKSDAGLRYLLASVFEESGRPQDAKAALRQALYIDPDHVLAHFSLANLLRRLGQPSRAAAHFSVARRLLDASAADAPLPDGEGLTAGRLREIIDATERIS